MKPVEVYKQIIDQLVERSPSLGARLVTEESIYSKAPAFRHTNDLVRALTPEQRLEVEALDLSEPESVSVYLLGQATRLILERHRYRVLTAVNGEDALRLYHRHQPGISAVLTDLMMPVMNGVSLVRALRALDPGLTIVATSGLGEIDQREELATLGVKEIVMKPCEVPVLIRALGGASSP